MEEIYSSKNITEDKGQEQLDHFFEKVLTYVKEDSTSIASMLITPESWAAKVNEDKKVLHSGINMNLLRYLSNREDASLEDDDEALINTDEKMKMLLNDIRVSMIMNQNKCQIVMLTMNKDLSDFQISFLETIMEKCKEYGEKYKSDMYIGFMNQLTSIDVEGLLVKDGKIEEEVETRLREIINSNRTSIKRIR